MTSLCGDKQIRLLKV